MALAGLGAAGMAIYATAPRAKLEALGGAFAKAGQGMGLVITDIVVDGREVTPNAAILAALGVEKGDPILGFSPEEARVRIEGIPSVTNARVERRMPGEILVHIDERRPFAIWQNQGKFSVIDRDGNVIATERLDRFGPLPLLVGVGAERAGAAVLLPIQAYPDITARTKAYVRVGERRWNLKLHNGADVLLPEGEEAAAIDRLAELQRQNGLLDRPLAAIDMRMPDRLVVRLAEVPEDPSTKGKAPPAGQQRR